MRRFEREVAGRTRFWEIELDGAVLVIATGELGRPGRTRRRDLRDPERAARELTVAVEQMLQSGWEEVAPEVAPAARVTPGWMAGTEMTALLEAPDDPIAYLVLGDRLLAEGDPRGELIAVQAALQADPSTDLQARERALLDRHREALLGPLAGLGPSRETWFCGFIRGLTLRAEGYSGDLAAALDTLAGTGELQLLRELVIDGDGHLDPVMHVLAAHDWPELRVLTLGGSVEARCSHALLPVLERLPRLEGLELRAEVPPPGRLVHASLARLGLSVAHGAALGSVDLSGLQALRELALHVALPLTRERGSLEPLLARPLSRLTGSGFAAVPLVDAAAAAHLPEVLVLGPTLQGGLLLERLQAWRAALSSVSIELRGVDVSDAELAALAPLAVDAGIPDVAVDRRRQAATPAQEVWRRYERRGRFWAIRRVGSHLEVRFGRIGSPGATRRTAHATAQGAGVDHRRRVRRKLAEGWEPVPG